MQQVHLDFGQLKSESEAKIDHLVFLEDLQGFSKSSNLLAMVVIKKTYNMAVLPDLQIFVQLNISTYI